MQIVLSTLIRLSLIISCCLPLLTSCESRKVIVNNLDEREANEIIVFLAGKGIDAVKVQSAPAGNASGGAKVILWDISVNANQGLDAMAYLNQAGLPRRRSYNLLDIFTGAGLVPSEMEQKIRYQAGLAEQIASTIRKIDGVLDAEVQISFPEEDPLNPNDKRQKITASVYIKHNGVFDDPNSHLVTKIKRLVAASVPGLDYDNVTVIGERARFSELSFGTQPNSGEDKAYVSIWGLVLAKESVTMFRIVFFTFTILIFFMIVILVWFGWKMYPILREHGGIKELFHLKAVKKPSSDEDKEEKAEANEGAKDKGKEAKKEGEKEAKKEPEKDAKKPAQPAKPGEATKKSLVDKDVDQT